MPYLFWKPKPRKCRICPAVFEPTGPRQRVCKRCKPRADKTNNAAACMRWREKYPEKYQGHLEAAKARRAAARAAKEET